MNRRLIATLLCTGLLFALTACTVCTEQIVGETTSPDHVWTTRTTVRDCGNLSVPTTNIYLQRADSRSKLGEIIVLVRHTHAVSIHWPGNAEVDVSCANCGADVRIARAQAHGVEVHVTR